MADFVVSNLDDTLRAFQRAGQSFTNQKNAALRNVGVPVATQAAALARARIRNLDKGGATVRWSQMRVGQFSFGVYVAPQQRGTRDARLRRTNLASLLLARAMVPAAKANLTRIERELDKALATMERTFRSG